MPDELPLKLAQLPRGDIQRQRAVAEKLGYGKLQRHIFLCVRDDTQPGCDQTKPKCCDRERSLVAWEFLKARLKELGLSEQGGVARTKANCLRICEGGPIAVVYPEGAWYGGCDPAVLEKIVDKHLVKGEIVEEFLLFQNPLDSPP